VGWRPPPPHPRAAPPPPPNAHRRWPVLAAAAGVVAVLALVALVASHGGGTSTGPTRGAAFPNKQERAVLVQLPMNLRDRCARGDPSSLDSGAEVTVSCSPAKLVSTGTYARFNRSAPPAEA